MHVKLRALSRTAMGLFVATSVSVALVSTAVSAHPFSLASRVFGGSFIAYA